jgi:pseudouridine synthase
MAKQRLQKLMAAAGVDSRRKCEELIRKGLVQVNQRVVDELPVFADPEKDTITVDGKKIQPERKVYYLLNKPKGVVCTNFDPQGRKKAVDIVRSKERLFCVGILDIDTTGLIILTNDRELTNKLSHPRYAVPKTYVARVKGRIDGRAVEKLKKGVWLAGGKTARAAVKILKRDRQQSLIEITIRQGINRQVRRMLACVGLSVKSLARTRIDDLTIRGLSVGKFRELTGAEVLLLKRAASKQ